MNKNIGNQRRTISIVANGKLDRVFIPEIRKSGFLIGVDKGAHWLIRHELVPNLAIGDFDSVTKSEMAEIEKLCPVKKFPPEKDWTDLELAVKEAISISIPQIRRESQKTEDMTAPHKRDSALVLGESRDTTSRAYASHIIIYGAIGTRLDHALAAVGLLQKIDKAGKTGLIKDAYNEVRLVSRETLIENYSQFPYVSIIPVSKAATISLLGMKYNASRLTIRSGETVGVSNEIRKKHATIIPHQGQVLVIRSRD